MSAAVSATEPTDRLASKDSAGALGYYTDPATGDFVVSIASSQAGGFALPSTVGLGRAVRVSANGLDPATSNAISDQLLGLWSTPAFKGVTYVFGYDAASGKVLVKTSGDPAAVLAALGDQAMNVTVSHAEMRRLSRSADYSPFWGGAQTKFTGWSNDPYDCTTGFTVHLPTGNALVTAGHCGYPGVGTTAYSPGSGAVQGSIAFRATFPTYDMEIINGKSYGAEIYKDNTTGVFVNGATDPVLNNGIYCYSGARTGTQCHQLVFNLDMKYCDTDGCTLHVMGFSYGDGNSNCGDSGAPFYLPGTTVGIRGMVFAGQTSDCTSSGPDNFAEKWSTIHSYWNDTIVTGSP
jgi:hypothetical protein